MAVTGNRSDERGTALVGVLLLLMMMSALAAALAVSGQTETLLARNHQSAAQARAAAEAGLNHGVQAAIAYIAQFTPAEVPDVLDDLLADPTVLPGIMLETPTPIAGAADPKAQYEVFIVDDDDDLEGVDQDDIEEDDDPLTDDNTTLIVRAIGRAQGNTTVTLEAAIGPIKLPAILSNGDFTLSGNTTLSGGGGSVHANGNLTVDGSVSASGYATASGTYTPNGNPDIDGAWGPGWPAIEVPPIRASDYLSQADFILTSAGLMTCNEPAGCGADAYGDTMCDASSNNSACEGDGWTFEGANGWTLSGDSPIEGAYYVETDVKITGNLAPHGDPPAVTIIAEGSIEIAGGSTPDFQPAQNLGGIQFVTDGDLKISANLHVPQAAGRMLVHEQLEITGNPDVSGQIFVENAASEDNLVTTNRITGNAKISYEGGLTDNQFIAKGWREVR